MIEIELFYNKAVLAVRSAQADYLKGQKRLPFAQELPKVEAISAEAYAALSKEGKRAYKTEYRKQRKALRKAKRAQKRPVEERLTRGYNAGIEKALYVFQCEYRDFERWLKNREE